VHMKVLYVTSKFIPATEWGGSVMSVAQLAQIVSHAGAHVQVVTTTARGLASLPKLQAGRRRMESFTATYFDVLGSSRFCFSPGLSLWLARHLRSYQVVHIQGLWTYPTLVAAGLCRALRIPYIISPRGALNHWAMGEKSLKKRLYFGALERNTIRGASLIHYTTEVERKEATQYAGATPAIVVPNAVDTKRFQAIAPHAENRIPVLLIAGRIHKVKGFDFLVPALAHLDRRGIEYELWIAGANEGNYLQTIKKMVVANRCVGRIRFLGNLSDQNYVDAVQRSDLLVMPSYQESFGIVAAEAMAAGKPVVVSNEVAISSLVRNTGAGMVVQLDPVEIADAIEALLVSRDRRRDMGAKAAAFVEEQLNPSRVAERMIDAYYSVQ
jgi:glycosyltransferase involved in cell wall biosynthesis